jgi:hypothetical protein
MPPSTPHAKAVGPEDPHRGRPEKQEIPMLTVAAFVVVKDNELLLDADASDQTLPLFDAPDVADDLPFILNFRLRPNTTRGGIRLRTRLNQRVVQEDPFTQSVKRPWCEVVDDGGILKPSGNTLRVEMLSLDGSSPPAESQCGVSNITVEYLIRLS